MNIQKVFITFMAILASLNLFGLEKLHQDYLIAYGNPEAAIHIIHYFSFQCPHCTELFQEEFKEIKAQYLDTNQVYWIFHPVPLDLLTIQGMDCLKKLTNREKRIFLEAILEEIILDKLDFSACLMEKAMEVFGKPIPKLQDKEYLIKTKTFQDAYEFLKQEEKITAVPTVEINKNLFLKEIPDKTFIESKLKKLLE